MTLWMMWATLCTGLLASAGLVAEQMLRVRGREVRWGVGLRSRRSVGSPGLVLAPDRPIRNGALNGRRCVEFSGAHDRGNVARNRVAGVVSRPCG